MTSEPWEVRRMQLQYTAAQQVHDVIAAIGRTEDVKFSPKNRRLAVASFLKNQITVFDLDITSSPNETNIAIVDAAVISSPYLKRPHGVDFLDEDRIIVANREGDVTIFELPSTGGGNRYDLIPIELICSGAILNAPGSVAISKREQNFCEVLICNNYGHNLTRHLIDLSKGCSVKGHTILLRKRLDVPDGVCASPQWIAVSNHDGQNVFLYENNDSLNESSEPDGILRCIHFPHGLRFTSDGCFLLVADAGAPYVHIYKKGDLGWRGVLSPFKSVKVLSDEDFLRGRHNPRVGGPKGIDVDNSMSTFVTTCETQPLVFFDLAEILKQLSFLLSDSTNREVFGEMHQRHRQSQMAVEVKYELERKDQLKEAVAEFTNRKSWRMTAPLRAVLSLLRRINVFFFGSDKHAEFDRS